MALSVKKEINMENKKVADYAASVSEACFKKDGDQESTTPPKS